MKPGTKPKRKRTRTPKAVAGTMDPAAKEIANRQTTCSIAHNLLIEGARMELLLRGHSLDGDDWKGPRPLPDGDALVDWAFKTAQAFVARGSSIMNAPLPEAAT